MGRCYAYASKHGPMPLELEAAYQIDRYGANSVYGRVLGVGEMRRMNIARSIIHAYKSREGYRNSDGARDWADWAAKNPDEASLLNQAMMEA